MCKNNCNKCSDPCNKPDPCNKSKACGCSINLETKCVKYTGNDLACTNIKKDTNLQDILTSLDEFLCFLVDEINNKSSIENIGGGSEIYSGRNEVTDANQLRTLVSSESVEVIQGEETISFEVEIPDVDVSNINTNVGTETPEGNEVYKGYNPTTEKHEFRRIISENLTVEERGDDLYIDYVLPDLGGVKDFFVNNNYIGVEEGSLVKPYSSIDNAVQAYIGNGTIIKPDNQGSRIVVQTSSSPYFFTSQLNIKNLLFEIEEGASIYYRGDEDYMIDTRILNALRTNETSMGVNFYGKGRIFLIGKGFAYCEGTGDDGVTGFTSTVVRVYEDLRIQQQYKTTSEYTNPLPKTQGGDPNTDPITSSGIVNKYWVGDSLELPIIVCDKDNASTVNFFVDESVLLLVSTQVAIHVINGGYFQSDRQGKGTVSISKFSQNFHVYKELDSSVTNGDPIKLIANEDFSYVRLEDSCLFITGDLYCAYGGGQYVYGENSGGFVLDSAIRVVASSGDKFIGINKSYFYSMRECDSVIKLEDDSASITMRNALFDDIYTCIEYLGGDGDFDQITLENSVLNGNIKNIDLTRGNSISVQNKINGSVVNSLRRFTNKAAAISNGLMSGALFFNIETDTVDIIS